MSCRKKNYTTTKREREKKLQIYNMEHSYN